MLKSKHVLIVSTLMSIFSLSACVKEETKYIEKQAPANMLESFSNTKLQTEKNCAKATCITIQKEALGKVYLLLASGVTSGQTPQWLDLKPLVVSFEKSGDRIALVGENYKSIYEEIKTRDLIQTFKIVSETEDAVTFNWGSGLKTFIFERSYDTDRESEVDMSETSQVSIPVSDSFITDLKVEKDGIELNQLSKVMSSKIIVGDPKKLDSESREESVNMNIQIRPYNLGSEFKSKVADASRRVGFFVTKVSKKGYSNGLDNLITKWDISDSKGPIRVLISSAVPADYIEAVKEGAHYWNKVIGKDLLIVETNVSPQVKPLNRSIVIRWIPWLDSGAAYAMGQSDPLTGEVLRAQVFMPSVFTKVGAGDLVNLNKGQPVAAIGAVACDISKSLVSLEKLMAQVPADRRLKLAQDSVRSTVAHELGHALGLRHNFAGSSSSKVSTAEIHKSAESYLKDDTHPGLETSTSIMDYMTGIDDILMSARLKHSALAYDKMAMDWAYSDNDSALSEQISKYCSDEDISAANKEGLEVYGCVRFDAGNNPLERRLLDAVSERDNIINILYASLIGRYTDKDNAAYQLMKAAIQQVSVWSAANIDLEPVSKMIMQTYKNDKRSGGYASITNAKTGMLAYSKVDLDEELNEQISNNLALVGGYSGLFSKVLLTQDNYLNLDWIEKQITNLENNNFYADGLTLTGVNYKLTSAEIALLKGFFENVKRTNANVLLNSVSVLLPKNKEAAHENGYSIVLSQSVKNKLVNLDDLSVLGGIYKQILAATSSINTDVVGYGLVNKVELPVAAVSLELRLKYAYMVSASGLRVMDSAQLSQARLVQKNKVSLVLAQVDKSVNLDMIDDVTKLPAELLSKGLLRSASYSWLTEELKLYQALKNLN